MSKLITMKENINAENLEKYLLRGKDLIGKDPEAPPPDPTSLDQETPEQTAEYQRRHKEIRDNICGGDMLFD